MTTYTERDFPSLSHFFGYLHQDWAEDHPSVWAVLDQFLADEPGSRDGLAADIGKLLEVAGDEDELAKACLQLGAYYIASSDGSTYRDWLAEVSDRTADWLGGNGYPS